jgi:hypothetical protein
MLFGDLNINYSSDKIIFKSGLNKKWLTEVGFILVLQSPCNPQSYARCDEVIVTRSADRLMQSTPITQFLNNTAIADCSTIYNQPYLQSKTLCICMSYNDVFQLAINDVTQKDSVPLFAINYCHHRFRTVLDLCRTQVA